MLLRAVASLGCSGGSPSVTPFGPFLKPAPVERPTRLGSVIS